jgi:hypothetical protein
MAKKASNTGDLDLGNHRHKWEKFENNTENWSGCTSCFAMRKGRRIVIEGRSEHLKSKTTKKK